MVTVTNLIDGFYRDAEDVARTALGLDVARLGRIALDLAPQAQDLDVDRAVVDLVVVQPREVEELVARKDAVRRAEHHHEQAEFAVGERHGAAVRTGQAPQVEVQLPAVEAIGADAVGLALAYFGAPAAQHRADAREQLARAEGLGDVVVGAELEAHHAIGLFLAPGEHHHGDLGLVAHAPRDRHAVLAAQAEVEHHQVDDL